MHSTRVLLALLGTFALLSTAPLQAPQAFPPSKRSASSKAQKYELKQLNLLQFVIRLLYAKYVDPEQFSAKKMFRGGLLRLEQKLDSFQVQFAKGAVEIQLGAHKQKLKIGRFLGINDVIIQLRKVAEVLQEKYKGKMPWADIEHAMVMGVMGTLDKQTQIVNPKHYRRKKRRYKRGKIGVVLRFTKGALSFVRVLPEGPAGLAGLRAGDRVMRINGQPVKGGDLGKWVGLIKGLRGSRLELHIQRKGWAKARRFVLIRALIPTPNVSGALLPGKIGYVRLRQFTHGSTLAIREELARNRHRAKGNLSGLILDLRHNPGGLVREAVSIASLFVEKGEVTTYAGANTKRRTYNVSGNNKEERYPMIVLLDGYSASASELLSGALKNHNRALVLGRQSYGKGTVQVAGPLRSLGLYFRITIAQYMVTGNQSIQAVGVTPDIEVLPVSLRKDAIRYYSIYPRDQALRRKRWPSFLLQNMAPSDATKSLFRLHYLSRAPGSKKAPKGKRRKKRKTRKTRRKRKLPAKAWQIDPTHRLGADFDVWLARYLLAHAKSSQRKIFFQQIQRQLKTVKRIQEKRLIGALRTLKLDWRRARKPKPIKLQAKLELVGAKRPIQTDKEYQLKLTVQNKGKQTAYRVRGILHAKSRPFRYRELLLGRIPAGRSRSQVMKFKLPASALSRVELLKFKIHAQGAANAAEASYVLPWRSAPRPRFAISVQLQDPSPDGNGDGRLQAGERARLSLVIRNVSKAPSPNLRLSVATDDLRVIPRLAKLGALKPGKALTYTFRIQVPDNAKTGPLRPTLYLLDRKLMHFVKHKLEFRVHKSFSGLTQKGGGWAVLKSAMDLYAAPNKQGSRIAQAKAGSAFPIVRRLGRYSKIRLPAALLPRPKGKKARAPQLFAWLDKGDFQKRAAATSKPGSLSLAYHYRPPRIGLKTYLKPFATNEATLPVSIASSQGIKDIFLMRGKRKVFYQALQFKKPQGKLQKKLDIAVPLKPGVQLMRLVVRTAQGRYQKLFFLTKK